MRYYRVLFVLLSLLFICCVSRKKNNIVDSDYQVVTISEINSTANKIKARLLNEDCKSVLGVVSQDQLPENGFVLFIYNAIDCEKCIATGFSIAKSIDSLASSRKVFIVSLMGNSSSEQTEYEYFDYIYDDVGDVIRKQLRYVPTPIMLYVDPDFKIRDILLPGMENTHNQNTFVEQFLNRV
jgi:uncharacterized protein YcfL